MHNTTTPLHETSDFLDGPRLCAWIDAEEGGELTNMDLRLGFHARRVREWRRGIAAHYDTAETILDKLGLHIGMVPTELYVPHPRALRSAA